MGQRLVVREIVHRNELDVLAILKDTCGYSSDTAESIDGYSEHFRNEVVHGTLWRTCELMLNDRRPESKTSFTLKVEEVLFSMVTAPYQRPAFNVTESFFHADGLEACEPIRMNVFGYR